MQILTGELEKPEPANVLDVDPRDDLELEIVLSDLRKHDLFPETQRRRNLRFQTKTLVVD
jgi:hypothetical protein